MNRAHFVSDLDTDRFLAWINILVPAAFAYQGMDVVAMWIPLHLDLTVTNWWLEALPQKLKTLAAILRKRFDASFGEFSSSTWVSCTCDCYLRSDVYLDSGYTNDRHASRIQWSFLASKCASWGPGFMSLIRVCRNGDRSTVTFRDRYRTCRCPRYITVRRHDKLDFWFFSSSFSPYYQCLRLLQCFLVREYYPIWCIATLVWPCP